MSPVVAKVSDAPGVKPRRAKSRPPRICAVQTPCYCDKQSRDVICNVFGSVLSFQLWHRLRYTSRKVATLVRVFYNVGRHHSRIDGSELSIPKRETIHSINAWPYVMSASRLTPEPWVIYMRLNHGRPTKDKMLEIQSGVLDSFSYIAWLVAIVLDSTSLLVNTCSALMGPQEPIGQRIASCIGSDRRCFLVPLRPSPSARFPRPGSGKEIIL